MASSTKSLTPLLQTAPFSRPERDTIVTQPDAGPSMYEASHKLRREFTFAKHLVATLVEPMIRLSSRATPSSWLART